MMSRCASDSVPVPASKLTTRKARLVAVEFSKKRKAAYYVGLLLIVLGALSLCSAPLVFFDRSQGTGPFGFLGAFSFRALLGVALIVIGSFTRKLGARGLAGSGVLLDAAMARNDLEPYARIGGGLLRDGLEAADVETITRAPQQVVRVRCRECEALSDEDANFCQQCGETL